MLTGSLSESCEAGKLQTAEGPNRVLIFRPGSLGDVVVSLPCFHLIQRVYPKAERRLLTNSPVKPVSVAARSLLDGSGLVDGYFEVDYSFVRSRLAGPMSLRKEIAQWIPNLLIYLPGLRGWRQLLEELLFFKLCGIRRVVGIPFSADLRTPRWLEDRGCFEQEGWRLARRVADLGDAHPEDLANWDLRLSAEESRRAEEGLGSDLRNMPLIVASVGTAVMVKDWGSENWCDFMRGLRGLARGYGLALVGAAGEFERAQTVRGEWSGPSVNLCGKLSPRESAAVMRFAAVYIGHDSGPMHLAAAAGVPCLAIFTAREQPGVWFPYGSQHRVIYHDVPCKGCRLDTCVANAKTCIMSITVDEALQAASELLAESRQFSR